MPLIHYRLALLILPIRRRLLLRKLHQWNSRPPFQLSRTWATIVCNSDYLPRPLLFCRARRWDWEDSNAESFGTPKNFNYNNFGDGDDDDEETEQWDNVLQEYIDSMWIFKVFSSYGWALPFILFPLVVINGPKAFLLALAVPIWISTFSFALQKMWNGKGKKRGNNKTRSSASSSSGIVDEFGKERKKSRMGYKSWVQWDDGDDDSSFGGWDKVDSERVFELRNSRRSGRSQKSPSEKSRLSEERIRKRLGRSRTPLLLRLLIAVFPFLSSWTKML